MFPWIGDRLQAGSILFEATEPRQPCYKFNAKMGFSHAAKMMLQAGDAVRLIPGKRETSIAQVNERRLKGRQRDLF